MKMSVLALSMSAITGTIYAEDQVQQPQVEGAQSSVATDAASSSSATTDASTQTSSVANANSVAPAANTDAHQAASALQKKKVMLAKRQTCKKYLLQMNVNIL